MADNLARYYARRAGEYERIYHKPERQADLAVLHRWLPRLLAGRRVLELACGTGYWTAVIAPSANSVLATDINEAVLAIARTKPCLPGQVEFRIDDAFTPDSIDGDFDAVLAAFWWSHLPRRRLPEFLDTLHARLAPGARVVLLDNRYVEGSSTPIARRDERGDTYQMRRLADGSDHEVLKNFPTERELRELLQPRATAFDYRELPYYWLLSYSV